MAIFLCALILPLSLSSVGLSSYVSLSVAPVFSHAENLVMDTLYFHTSGEVRIESSPVELSLEKVAFGPYCSLLIRSDSLEYGDIVFLGYSMFSLGLQSHLKLSRHFDLGLSLGAGEGKYSYNETLFALLESELFAEFPITRPLRARTGLRYTRREGFSDYALSIGLSLVKDGPR